MENLLEVENLEFGADGNFTGTGNARANRITGGAGDDTLDGGLGADRMEGGAGNDTYFVDRAPDNSNPDAPIPGDVVFEGTLLADSGGIDTVKTALRSYTLGVNVENLVFVGTGNFSGTG